MELVSKFKEGFRFLLCVIDIFSKYAWVILFEVLLLKMLLLRGITITNAFQKILDESNRKPNKILEDKGSEFYNWSIKSWLEKKDIEMHPTYNEWKSIVTERLIRNLNNQIY